jgi:putative mRNA 3-end processing factor
MTAADLLTMTPAGLFCPDGGFYIDPVRATPRAVISHGHSDHARSGHGAVLATAATLRIMGARYGDAFADATQAAQYGEPVQVGEVRVTLRPAGHVLGSAQIVIEGRGRRIVVSGDYKRRPDPTCAGFEPVVCDVFVSEATFGLPVFRHPDPAGEVEKLIRSTRLFPERAHLVGAYALGKAQRMAALVRAAGWRRPIYIHGAMEKLMRLYELEGISFGEIRKVAAADRKMLGGEIIICPPSAIADLWSRRFPDPVSAVASGWMRVRARARQSGAQLPLVISDHADWDELCATVLETRCEELWVTHGAEDALVHWAKSRGLRARPLHLLGYGEEEEASAGSEEA